MTTWSGFTNHLSIGYDVWTDGYDTYTPSINVYIQISIRNDNWPFNDDQQVVLSGSTGATWNYHNGMGNSQSMVIGTATIAGQGQNYNGGPTYSFHAQINGVYLGAGPAIDFSYTLPPRPHRPPTAPGAPSASGVTAIHADFGWSYPADDGGLGADYTWLQIATDAGFGGLVYDNQSPGWNGRSLSIFAPNTTYWMRDAAHNGAGWSGWSGTSSFATNAYQVSAPVWSAIGPTTATLTWGSPPTTDTASQYNVQIATDSAFTALVSNVTAAWATTYSATGLQPNVKYYSRVRASTSTGWGAWSATSNATTLSGAKVMRGGVWVDAPAYIYRNGAWVVATVYKGRGGAWNA
jgi:hypothetical protein